MDDFELNYSGVVSGNNCTNVKIEWRSIPGYTSYEANSLGFIRKVGKDGSYSYPRIREKKTSVGTYLNCFISPDIGSGRDYGIHHYICLAFHGFPPFNGKRYEANHKDGNKHNNVPGNLEWVTRSENTLHALKSGLRKDNIPVEVFDAMTGLWVTYYSIVEFARHWNISRQNAKELIVKYRETMYQSRWKFKIDPERFRLINRSTNEDIKFLDYVTGNMFIVSTCTEAEYLTGVKSMTILLRTGNRKITSKDKDGLLAGYVFKRLTDETPFPTYTKETAEASRTEYFSKNIVLKRQPYSVKDYRTGEVREYPTLSQACLAEGLKYSVVGNQLRTKKKLELIKGRVFKLKSDSRVWPEYSAALAEHSVNARITKYPPLSVIDLLLNTTKLYSCVAEFAREIGKNPDSFGSIVRSHKGKLYKDRYLMECVTL